MSEDNKGPSCAVAIGTRGRGDQIVALLESLQRSDLEDFEVVIVDQSTDTRTTEAVAPFLADQRFTYRHLDEVGVSRARNHAVSLTTAPIIAITDDDCILTPDWLSAMTAPFRDDEHLAVVFCNVEPVNEPPGKAGHTPQIAFDQARTVRSVEEAWRLGRDGLCLGAGMAVRRRAFDDVGGFDVEIGPGRRYGSAEDNDLSWRALIAGWTVRHEPGAVVLHDGFRDLDEFRQLVNRDFFGVGGVLSKYIRFRRWAALALVVSWLWSYGVADPAKQVFSARRPSGFRRPAKLLQGVVAGLRSPVDRATLKFEPLPSK